MIVAPGIALAAYHVFKEKLDSLSQGEHTAICFGISKSGLQAWRISNVTHVGKSDIVILGLVYASKLPERNTFRTASITTRLPRIGEKLTIVGFRASQRTFNFTHNNSATYSGRILVCAGKLSARYQSGRDSCMAPWPGLEINCPSWGGMSGGPVFDDTGKLVGLLSLSFDSGPSYVSLAWPALGAEFEGGWPRSYFSRKKRLVDLGYQLCEIDKPSAIRSIEDRKTGFRHTEYQPWE